MDVRTNSEYLDFLAKRLDEFSKTFEEFMTHHVENSGFGAMAVGMAPAVLPKESADKARVRVLTDELNRLAGALMDLSSVTGVRLAVQGAGVLDPFVNWQRMLEPKPLLDAPVVRGCCLQAAGRLEGLKAKAEALSSPAIDPSLLHPLVWAAAQRLWNDGHLRQGVAAAAEAVSGQMKQLTGRNNASDTSLWQQAFAAAEPQEGKPRLRWPGDPDDQDVKTMQAGLLSFAPGVNMVIRNPATHVAEDFTEQDGLEQLATLSVLAKFLDRCVVVSVDGATTTAAEQVFPEPAGEANSHTLWPSFSKGFLLLHHAPLMSACRSFMWRPSASGRTSYRRISRHALNRFECGEQFAVFPGTDVRQGRPIGSLPAGTAALSRTCLPFR